MQSDEPIASAEYVLVTPKSRKLQVDAKVPGLKQTTSMNGDQRIYRFVAENVPAIEPEPNMPPWSELLGFVHVSTYQSWEALGRWYWGLAKDQLDLDEETRRLAREITKDRTTELDRVKAVYEVGDQEHALRGAGVWHLRLQAAALRADDQSRVGRLQRQGNRHRHPLRETRHRRQARDRAHGDAR